MNFHALPKFLASIVLLTVAVATVQATTPKTKLVPQQQPKAVLGFVELDKTTVRDLNEELSKRNCTGEIDFDDTLTVSSECFGLPGNPSIKFSFPPMGSPSIELEQQKIRQVLLMFPKISDELWKEYLQILIDSWGQPAKLNMQDHTADWNEQGFEIFLTPQSNSQVKMSVAYTSYQWIEWAKNHQKQKRDQYQQQDERARSLL